MLGLTGKMALVTGGSGLYGTALSETSSEPRAHVIITSRDRARCKDWAAKMTERGLKASAGGYDLDGERPISRKIRELSEGGAGT